MVGYPSDSLASCSSLWQLTIFYALTWLLATFLICKSRHVPCCLSSCAFGCSQYPAGTNGDHTMKRIFPMTCEASTLGTCRDLLLPGAARNKFGIFCLLENVGNKYSSLYVLSCNWHMPL